MTDPAACSAVDRGRRYRTIDRFAGNGWVRGVRYETNKRGRLTELADEGMAVVRRAALAHADQVRSVVFDRLDLGQRGTLREICD